MANPEAESEKVPLRLDFDRRLKLGFNGSRIASDTGLLAFRELDDAYELTGTVGCHRASLMSHLGNVG